MRKYPIIVISVLLFFACCKKKSSDNTDPNAASSFDGSKGWKLVQTIINDDQPLNPSITGHMGFNGLDFSGAGGNLRVYYWEGWQNPGVFNYSAARLDEYDSKQKLVTRKELPFINQFQTNTSNPENYYLMLNGKPSILTQTNGTSYGRYWQVLGSDSSKVESAGQFAEFVGALTWADDHSVNITGQLQDHVNYRLEFNYKWYAGNKWQYLAGVHPVEHSDCISGQVIGNVAYAYVTTNTGTDTMYITVYSCDTAVGTFTKFAEQAVSLAGFGNTYNVTARFMGNGNTPLLILTNETKFAVYQIDIATHAITLHSSCPAATGVTSWAVCGNVVYVAGKTGESAFVSKIGNGSLVPVGSPGFCKNNSFITLVAVNNKLYSVTNKPDVPHEQLYIATPQ